MQNVQYLVPLEKRVDVNANLIFLVRAQGLEIGAIDGGGFGGGAIGG